MKELIPLSENCQNILTNESFAVIGISPFNSYFSVENITKMIKVVASNFNDFCVFIPDKVSTYTLESLGYTASEAKNKTRKQDNYLKNKVKKALEIVAENYKASSSSILLLSEMLKNNDYMEVYESCRKEFNSNDKFREGCIDASNCALESNTDKRDIEITQEVLLKAVEYFLYELPLFMDLPKIQHKESAVFIYTCAPQFIEHIYRNRNESTLISPSQAYAIYPKDGEAKLCHS
jgi:cyclo(L-tyrosyl-L-tyrosyl) synthase